MPITWYDINLDTDLRSEATYAYEAMERFQTYQVKIVAFFGDVRLFTYNEGKYGTLVPEQFVDVW